MGISPAIRFTDLRRKSENLLARNEFTRAGELRYCARFVLDYRFRRCFLPYWTFGVSAFFPSYSCSVPLVFNLVPVPVLVS
jgi:hypothetical protein